MPCVVLAKVTLKTPIKAVKFFTVSLSATGRSAQTSELTEGEFNAGELTGDKSFRCQWSPGTEDEPYAVYQVKNATIMIPRKVTRLFYT